MGAALIHAEQTDGHDETNLRFSQLCEGAQKLLGISRNGGEGH